MVVHFARTTKVFLQTLPYVLVRMAVGIVFGLVTVLYVALVGGAVYLAASMGGELALFVIAVVVLVSAGVFFKLVSLARTYVLYLVSAAHIATITEIVSTGSVPDGQLSFGKEKVKSKFVEASALAVVDQLVEGVINQFNGALFSMSRFLRFVPAMDGLLTILQRTIAVAGNHLDEAILAHMFLHEDTSNWTAARDGLVLYAKVWKPVLGSALVIVLAMYAVDAVLLLSLVAMALVVANFSLPVQVAVLAVGIGAIVTIHFGLVGPWVKTVIVTTFLIESREETPDSKTMDFLSEKSSKFRELTRKATDEPATEQDVEHVAVASSDDTAGSRGPGRSTE